ncbi:hypothetical protein DXC27_10345 [Ruminococcus sp. OM08-7]|nr:hypothetical protein DXC27_10345 [Ruminococcus sp. OM08-7]
MNNTQLRKIRNVLPFLLEKSEFEFTFFKSEQGSDSFREPAGYTIRTGFRLQNITFPRMNHFPIGMCRMRFYRNRRKRRVNRNPVPIEKCIFGKILQLQEVFFAPKIILLKKVYLKTKGRW